MATEYLYLDDYKVGDRMVSPARTITESDIVNFAALTGDWHPLHTDVEYAARTPFKGRIAHGMLVLSIGLSLPFRLGQYSSYLPKSFIAFYGMEGVRFTAPTRIGDTIRCEVEVIEITDKGKDAGVLTVRNRIVNQKDETAATFVMKLFCGKRPA
ncbi:MAG: MaoC/PaaZ C-terminal domain-containing protein [Pseudomonadota bacterium]|jgi:acyl dehydratase|nr:MaoC family dehydratase N-terminal domain-containing protein [Syntrophaceae bacterium]MDI9555412.1 MaoC/PaaZ C-terminal domain-containing protein [Pseudomonadota bacterium]NLX30893.1 dehydratase [Deltaproteobacteria bacterium]HNU84262.1 MaoC/PaaZ C-terminal domain-containing protein [Syntrophales bacterium]HNZ33803.1 MaoC/PaaZ C-terminal domain-containing protein [Syntrophales bacterium]